VGSFNIVLYFLFVLCSIIKIPYWDLLDIINEFYSNSSFLSYLWTQHIDHRLVISKLVTALDLSIFNGNLTIYAFFQLVIYLCIIFLGIMLIRRMNLKQEFRYLLCMIFITTGFSVYNYVDTIYPINFQYVAVFLCSILSFIFLLLTESWYGLLIAAVFALLSQFSLINGILIWLIDILFMLKNRRQISKTFIFIGISLLVNVLYFYHYQRAESIHVIAGFWHFMSYFLQVQALPWSIMPHMLKTSFVWGVVLTGAEIYTLYFFVMKKNFSKYQEITVAVLAFCLASTLLVSLGRSGIGVKVGGRYAIFSQMALLSFLLFYAPYIERFWYIQKTRKYLMALCILFCIVQIPVQFALGTYYKNRALDFESRMMEIVRGNRNPEITYPIYPQVNRLDDFVKMLKSRNLIPTS
jgi:hypothetical protein